MTLALRFEVIHERNLYIEHADVFFCYAPGPDLDYTA